MKINRNIFYSEILFKLFSVNKIKDICISPGSRSTPLIFPIAKSKQFNKFVNLDERSSAFFALGLSRTNEKPAILITTSGTAVAELYPAIIEAFYQRIPLIVITADRPEKFRNTGANQTINQNNIFSNHTRYSIDLSCQKPTQINITKFINHVKKGIDICLYKDRGPIHINIQFDKPFEPDNFTDDLILPEFNHLITTSNFSIQTKSVIPNSIKNNELKTLIISGPNNYSQKELKAIIDISNLFKAPIFADAASNLRKFQNRNILGNFNSILVSEKTFSQPERILSFGLPPTSIFLQNYFEKSSAQKIMVNEFGDINDPSKTFNEILSLKPSDLYNLLKDCHIDNDDSFNIELIKLNAKYEKIKNQFLKDNPITESSLTTSILKNLPTNSNLIVANSTLIRDLDYFVSSHKGIDIYSLRGASGIDGNISFALGVLAKSKKTTSLLIGDLSFLYDINGLLIANKYDLPLNIILLNNDGGGIFNHLPISKYQDICEDYFIARQSVNIKDIAEAYKCLYYNLNDIKTMENLSTLIALNKKNIQLFEINTDSVNSTKIKKSYWETLKVKNQL